MTELELTPDRYRNVFLAYLWRAVAINVPFGLVIGLIFAFLPIDVPEVLEGAVQLVASAVAIYIALRWMLRSDAFQGFRIALIAKESEAQAAASDTVSHP